MFQTEFIKFLQSFESSWLTYFMAFITSFGYPQFFFVAFLIIIFGIDFKKGFVLIQVLLLTAATTEFLKNVFALPRPFQVDSNVIRPDISRINDAPFTNMGAGSFFGLLPQEVTDYYRNLPDKISYGFPSGHTSSAVTFWGSLTMLFENKYIKYTSLVMIVLVPFSRLYLGRHFPADIWGGYILGILILVIMYNTFFESERLSSFLLSAKMKYGNGILNIIFNICLIALPLIFFLLLPYYFSKFTGYWFGMNAAFLIIADYKTLIFAEGIQKRIISVLTAAIIFSLTELLLKVLISILGLEVLNFALFFRGAVVSFAGIFITLNINRKLKLYK